jgi:hypothetical protein
MASAASTPAAQAPAAPRLSFAVDGAEALRHAAVPTLRFALRIDADGAAVRSILLDAQLQIAARRRRYATTEHEGLLELFGESERWGTTLHTLPWTRVTLVVPPFQDRAVVDLDVACSYDLEVSASRYFAALAGGAVPLELLFSGTLFYAGAGGLLQTARIGLDQQADFDMPVALWREAMDRHFPGAAWLRLRRETFERLARYKARRALPTWDEAIDALLEHGERP